MGKREIGAALAAVALNVSLSVSAAAEPDEKLAAPSLEEVRIEAPPRAKQIEPVVVEPVKRVKPKTPEIAEETNAKSDSKKKSGGDTKKSVKLVGERPNCDKGYKPDSNGKSCVRVADSSQPKKKKR